jgi:hypothetical protein
MISYSGNPSPDRIVGENENSMPISLNWRVARDVLSGNNPIAEIIQDHPNQ